MAKKWSEVAGSAAFQSLSPQEQQAAQNQYFNEVVLPKAQENGYDVNAVSTQFFAENKIGGLPETTVQTEPTVVPSQTKPEWNISLNLPQQEIVAREPQTSPNAWAEEVPTVSPRERRDAWRATLPEEAPIQQSPRDIRNAEATRKYGMATQQAIDDRSAFFNPEPTERDIAKAERDARATAAYGAATQQAIDDRAAFFNPEPTEQDLARKARQAEATRKYGEATQEAFDERTAFFDRLINSSDDEDPREALRAARAAAREQRKADATAAYGRATQEAMDQRSGVMEDLKGMKDLVNQPVDNTAAGNAYAAMYKDKEPSIWDTANIDPNTLPKAAEDGYTLNDLVHRKTLEKVEANPEMSYGEAEKEVRQEEARTGTQLAAGLLAPVALPALGVAPLSLPALAAMEGGVNAAAGATADLLGGKGLDGERTTMDAVYGALGPTVGGVLGKTLSKMKGGKAAKTNDLLENEAFQKLNAIGQQAKVAEAYAGSVKLYGPKKLNEVLEGTETITAKDVINAAAKADAINKVAKAGGKAGTDTLAEMVPNAELRGLLKEAATKAEGMAKGAKKVNDITGLPITDLLGFSNRSGKLATSSATRDVMANLRKSANDTYEGLRTVYSFSKEQDKALTEQFKQLGKASKLIGKGKVDEAADILEHLAKVDDQIFKSLGDIPAKTIRELRGQLEAYAGLRKMTADVERATTVVGMLQQVGIATPFAFWHNPALAIGGKVAQAGAKKMYDVGVKNRLDEVNRALGGKLKVDEKVRQMVEEGRDLGAIIGYAAMKAAGLETED